MIALVGAMFVALPSAGAQSMMYYCTDLDSTDSVDLHVTNMAGTVGYVLDEEGADAGKVTSKVASATVSLTDTSNADACETVSSKAASATNDENTEELAKAGDRLVVSMHDVDTEADDRAKWQRVYKEDIGAAKSTTMLYLDDPDNENAGANGATRPQKTTIARVQDGADSAVTTYSAEPSSGVPEIVTVVAATDSFTFTAAKAGTVTITVKHPTTTGGREGYTETFVFTVKDAGKDAAAATAERSVTIEIDDTDDTVSNAMTDDYRFTITTNNIPALPLSGGGVPSLTVYISGELDNAQVYTGARDADGRWVEPDTMQTLDDGKAEYIGWVNVPKGTTPGEYTLDVTIYTDGETSSTRRALGTYKAYSGSDVLIVGDAGTNVSEAVLVLSPLDADGDPVAEGTSQKTQPSSSAAKGDPIRLTLTALNALGNASNPWIDVTVTAAGATIKHSHSINAKGEYEAESGTSGRPNSLQLYGVDVASIVVEITKDTPGEVEVSALVVDPQGSGYDGSDKVTLTFTGPAKTVSLSDATTTLLNRYVDHKDDTADDKDTDPRDNISLKLTASDADDHAVVPTGNATVTIAGPEGSMVATDGAGQKIVVSQKVTGTTNTISLRVAESVTAANPLKSGEYTVTAKDGARKDTAMFTVVGTADMVSMEASEADEDGQIEVTVTVTDADGNPVADGTVVTVREADLRGDDDQVLVLTNSDGKTKAGVAKATFIEIGPGRAAIVATADGKTDVVRVTSTFDAPEPEAMPEEEASVSCLSELSGFATWSCGVEADASEIFDMVSGRGVTALHLWNGSTWVRYSVVDGAMVPGSSDFMVTKSDILYISN